MDTDPLIGRVLGDTYEVEQRLGAGGMGAVYTAKHVRTGRRYAVKVLHPERQPAVEAVQRFQREAKALAALGHAGIVAIHDFAESDGLPYMVMDLLDGESLEQRINQRGHLSWTESVAILDQVAAALGAAHRLGIIHRDLKPANIFLANQEGAPERATVLDFGLAKMLEADEDGLTTTGVGMGTPLYMSPEQASGQPIDARTDVYALGVVLFEMLVGKPPFTGSNAMMVLGQVMSDPPPSVSSRAADGVPQGLDAVMERALAKHSDERFESADALVGAVHEIEGSPRTTGIGVGTTQPSTTPGVTRPATPIPLHPVTPSTSETALARTVPSVVPPQPQDKTAQTSTAAAVLSVPPPARPGHPQLIALLVCISLMMAGAIGYLVATRPDGSSEQTSEPALEPEPAVASAAPHPKATEVPGVSGGVAMTEDFSSRVEGDAGTVSVQDAGPALVGDEGAGTRRSIRQRDGVPQKIEENAPDRPSQPLAPTTPDQAHPDLPKSVAAKATIQNEQMISAAAEHRQTASEIDDFLKLVRRARLETKGLAQGKRPQLCTSNLRGQLEQRSKTTNPVVSSAVGRLRTQIKRVCGGFDSWRSPTPDQQRLLQKIDSTLDRSEKMARDTVSTNQPQEVAQKVIAAIAKARQETRGVVDGKRPFPCQSSTWPTLQRLTNAGNSWSGTAARRVTNLRDRICRSFRSHPNQHQQAAMSFAAFLDTTEGSLRSTSRTHLDIADSLAAAHQ